MLSKLNENKIEIEFEPGDFLIIIDKSSKKKIKYKGICIGIKKRKVNSTIKILQSQKESNITFTFPINKKVFDIKVLKEERERKIKKSKLYNLRIKNEF